MSLSLTTALGMRTIIIDNYDSFTYNLHHYLEAILNTRVDVVRNDAVDVEALDGYDQIVLSPGPGLPQQAGITMDTLAMYAHKKRILGVCLGHQAIGLAFGATLKNLSAVHHGVSADILLQVDDYIFRDIQFPCEVGRYHSWVVSANPWPDCLEILATDAQGEVMALRHKTYDVRGIQFHPESIMTVQGFKMMENWALRK
jgi:anthranilate synthase component 2